MNKEHCSETLYDCMALVESGLNYKRCAELRLPFICFKKNVEVPPSLGKCTTVDPAYKLHGILNSCYKFHPEPRKWSEAFKTCSAEGAYLAIVNSDEEVEHLKNLFAEYPPKILTSDYKDCVFLGYRIFGDETITNHPLSYFYTIHGQLLDQAGYNRWSVGQPNRSGNCGGMYRTGLLNDIWCHVPYAFICEKDPQSY
ncbi:hemolymph lipopolysaccharide-binding protein-like [Hyposmocoma kahamanoa]|uniref:hemolymph lipopolysaccharide-binding protein-like n=1 Tax=Hyposmocoma kahamanoa TaxID=1477025 RepID=UPI000E6D6CA1|nr:hemolymph lipopolysaccharide-binding protein-like [Hyposmocoma kahamanoa]